MTASAWTYLAAFMAILLVAAWPIGLWLARLASGEFPRWMHQVEAPLYRLAGTSAGKTMDWVQYALAVLAFNLLGALVVYALQRLQAFLPLNPAGMPAVTADSAFNTAISFASNTDWQGYGGESTMSYLTQMLGLGVQNFLSAATGIAVVFALIRGFAARGTGLLGNFWVDLTRVTLWVLLPLSLAGALFLVQQGVVQNFDSYKNVQTVETVKYQEPKLGADGQPLKNDKGDVMMEDKSTDRQVLAMGPVASQIAIKQLGTNGGGFFNANSAHPFENPTQLSNFVQLLAILLIPAALCFTFGHMVQDRRQGWTVLAAMVVLFLAATIPAMVFEQQGNPRIAALGVDQSISAAQSGGNMEGKEVRFGTDSSALWASATTAASNGSVNSMHDSYTPLGGLVTLLNIQLGEVVFGGVGSGLYGMVIFALVAVFIAGLMIGRTPEYLGKKIEAYEMKMSSIVILVTPLLALLGTALGVMTDAGRAAIANPGAHGFSEVLYAFSSAANNNGSAFAGLGANTQFYNTALGICMWLGRFAIIVPVLAIAGSLSAKRRLPVTSGTLPTHGALFAGLLVGTVLLVGLLNYVPALALGPVVEHLALWSAK
jgi:K+-transporting ATPase ATPase A chain